MPLFKIIQHNTHTKILIWHTTESLDELKKSLELSPESQSRLKKIKFETHQKSFLSIRKLLEYTQFTDFDLKYDVSGKPFLHANKTIVPEISISHTDQFATIIISNQKVGIDVEKNSEKFLKLAHKFINAKMLIAFEKHNYSDLIKILTINWGARESIFKIVNQPGISFKNHIVVTPFELTDSKITACLYLNQKTEYFDLFFNQFENHTLTYCFEKNI